jgi:hypothetical protein
MGVRFRKRIKLYNISRQGVRETFSVPGAGISYQTEPVGGAGQRQRPLRKRSRRSASPGSMLAFVAVTVIILWALAHLR